MTFNYDEVKAAVKALGNVTDNDAFLEGFLSAFKFPQATYSRLKARAKGGVNEVLRVQGNRGLYFLASTAASLNSEFNILKKNNDLNKIKEAYIIIVNQTDILAFERDSGDTLETSKKDLHRYIEFFFSLLGIRRDTDSAEMQSVDKKAAEKFAELYDELRLKNHNLHDDIAELLCRLIFCCFADNIGVLTNEGLRSMVSIYTDSSGDNTSSFFCNLFDAVKSEARDGLPGYFQNIKYVDSRLFENSLPLLDFSRKARQLVLDLMGLDWSDISPDVLGMFVQSVVRDKAKSINNNNYTSTANIQKVINPLFMDGLYQEFERVKANSVECEALLKRVESIAVFDPSSATGNFLLVAYKELNRLAAKIKDAINGFSTVISRCDVTLSIPWQNFMASTTMVFPALSLD